MTKRLTGKRHKKIVEAVKMGAYDHVAAHHAGITPETFYDWLERGRCAPRATDVKGLSIKDLRLLARSFGVYLNGQRTKYDISNVILSRTAKYREFADDLEQAWADAECSASASMRRAWESGDWRAAECYLKRKHPDRWGQTDQVLLRGQIEHRRSAPQDTPQTFAELGVSADQVEVMGRLLAQAESGRLPAPIDSDDGAPQHGDDDGGDR